jgi:hypothetical protein
MKKVVVVGYGYAGKGFHCYLVNKATNLSLFGVVPSGSGVIQTRLCEAK